MGNPNHEGLSHDEIEILRTQIKQGVSTEALLSQYIQKKASKEIRGTGNPPAFQSKLDEAKPAARIVYGQEAAGVRRKHADCIMGSRYVITIKQEDGAPERVKARWWLQGYLDPVYPEESQ